jgi:5-methyltetrahydrofolate--homocysteine methyltransferase
LHTPREDDQDALKEGWLRPQGVYGLFPCQSEGDDLVIYDPGTIDTASPETLVRFSFPRQPYDQHLALSDYFASTGSGKMDVVPSK